MDSRRALACAASSGKEGVEVLAQLPVAHPDVVYRARERRGPGRAGRDAVERGPHRFQPPIGAQPVLPGHVRCDARQARGQRLAVAGERGVDLRGELVQRQGGVPRPAQGEEVVVAEVDDDPGEAPPRALDAVSARAMHRVRVGEGVDAPVQGDAPADAGGERGIRRALHEVAHQRAQPAVRRLLREQEMGEVVHCPSAWARVTAAAATMSLTSAPRERSHIGARKPCRKGPIARALPKCWTSL